MGKGPLTQEYVSEVLCAQCARAGLCTIPNDTEENIFSCEFFVGFKTDVRVNTGPADDAGASDANRTYGLCGDCENRGHCMFRQREGGVWHCEEYC